MSAFRLESSFAWWKICEADQVDGWEICATKKHWKKETRKKNRRYNAQTLNLCQPESSRMRAWWWLSRIVIRRRGWTRWLGGLKLLATTTPSQYCTVFHSQRHRCCINLPSKALLKIGSLEARNRQWFSFASCLIYLPLRWIRYRFSKCRMTIRPCSCHPELGTDTVKLSELPISRLSVKYCTTPR